MAMTVKVDENFFMKSRSSRMNDLRLRGILCDTTVVTSDLELSAHSLVLAAASPIFETALANFPKTMTSYRLEMVGLDGATMANILQLIYTGMLDISEFTPQQNRSLLNTCEQLHLDLAKMKLLNQHVNLLDRYVGNN